MQSPNTVIETFSLGTSEARELSPGRCDQNERADLQPRDEEPVPGLTRQVPSKKIVSTVNFAA